ncbi:archaemetzincin [Nannocystaceae bacterium ST9]
MSVDRRTWLAGVSTTIGCLACERAAPRTASEREPTPSEDREPLPPGHEPPPSGLPIGDEPGQDLASFLTEPRRPITAERRTLELLPIGEYPRGFVVEYERVHLVRSPELELLRRFASAWFGLPVRVAAALSDELLETQAPQREFEGRRQFDAEALLGTLAPLRSPDAHSLLGLTLEDLWSPSLEGQWVFGLAAVERGLAIHSMLRYDPGLRSADERPPDFERIIRDRGLRVLVHELGHLLGIRHCVHFCCVMNPTAGLADLDRLPLRLCPICLDKLNAATGVDRLARALALRDLYAELGMIVERDWMNARIAEATP